MNDTSQIFPPDGIRDLIQDEVVGMDAHSRKLFLCHMRRKNGRSVKVKCIATTLDALEGTYAKHFPADIPTVLEASTNSFHIAKRLAAIGRKAVVLASDVLSGAARKDRINDRIDAENLARVALKGDEETLRAVFVSSARGAELREEYFAYRDARKDATRTANRIWSFCSRHGLDVDGKIGKKRCEALLKEAKARGEAKVRGWGEGTLSRAKGLVEDWLHAEAVCNGREKILEKEVFGNPAMTRLQQVPGIRFVGAFALVAFVEEIRRFRTAKKLSAYIGLNPTVNRSGEEEGNGKLSKFGRRDLKAVFVEAAQSAMKTDSPLVRWAKHLLARGKPWNVAMAALARKLSVLCWHILIGHPVPDRERERAMKRKLALPGSPQSGALRGRLAGRVEQEAVKAAGYGKKAKYVAAVAAKLYGHLPEARGTDARKIIEKEEKNTKGASGRLTKHIDAKHWQNAQSARPMDLPISGKKKPLLPSIGKSGSAGGKRRFRRPARVARRVRAACTSGSSARPSSGTRP
jgi:transposase